jgi:hypothetical protein
MLKISLDEVTRQQLARLATKHSVAPEALAASYILRGIQNARFWILEPVPEICTGR